MKIRLEVIVVLVLAAMLVMPACFPLHPGRHIPHRGVPLP
jgi:hypothetical protein